MTVSVSPPGQAAKPFFLANIRKVPYVPSIPLHSGMAKYVGVDMRLAQPPLPAGDQDPKSVDPNEVVDYLVGTDEWQGCITIFKGWSKLCSIDVQWPPSKSVSNKTPLLQPEDVAEGDWLPAYKLWSIGMWIENGTMDFRDARF
jgi:hypothetical protein